MLEKERNIVAHAAIWPVILKHNNSTIRGIQMIDWASSKDSPGAGLALVQKLAAMSDFMYSIGGSDATRKVLPAFGFTQYAQQWRAVQPLRPVRQVLTHQDRNWKLAPRLARNWLWSKRLRLVPSTAWQIQEIAPGDISTATELDLSAVPGVIPRPAAFFEYLLECPAVVFKLYAIHDGSTWKGHFLLSLVRGQARLAGLWLEDPTSENLSTAFRLIRTIAMSIDGANELTVTGSDASCRQAVLNAGFKLLSGPPVYILDKKSALSVFESLQFQFVDDDAAFLDSGTYAYWS